MQDVMAVMQDVMAVMQDVMAGQGGPLGPRFFLFFSVKDRP